MSMVGAMPKDKSGVFLIFAVCNPTNIDKVDKAIAEELDKFVKDGITEKELTEAKKAYLQQMKVQRSSDSALSTLLSQSLWAGRTLAYYSNLEEKINGLTVAQVNEAIRKYYDPKRLTIVRAGDFHKKAPEKK
jgi:zinc protease